MGLSRFTQLDVTDSSPAQLRFHLLHKMWMLGCCTAGAVWVSVLSWGIGYPKIFDSKLCPQHTGFLLTKKCRSLLEVRCKQTGRGEHCPRPQ